MKRSYVRKDTPRRTAEEIAADLEQRAKLLQDAAKILRGKTKIEKVTK